MPVEKVSDAPPNVQEIDGARLTLAQVNYILRVYDGLKEEGEVESPMAVAIAQFKKAYRKEGDKWVERDKGASMLDLNRLDDYIVIRTGTADPPLADLRELEGDYPAGVHALWSDEEATIVAFVFDPSKFDEEGARAWIDQNVVTQAGQTWPVALWENLKKVAAMALLSGERFFTSMREGIPFDIAAITVGDKWYISSGSGLKLAEEDRAWDWTTEKQDAIIEAKGWSGYARAHLVTDLSQAEEGQKWPEVKDAYTYPMAEMIGGDLSVVLKAAQAIYQNMRGGRAKPDLPRDVLEAGLDTIKKIYRRFGRDTDDMALRGFDETRRLVQSELDRLYGRTSPDGAMLSLWIVEIGPQAVIFEREGRQWAAGYNINDFDTVTIAPPAQVAQEWVRPDGSTIMLYSFPSELGPGLEADGGDDGLVWKEIVRPGKFFKTNTGLLVEITADIIKSAYEAWRAGLPQYVSVSSKSHHADTFGVVPADQNKGFVDKLKLVGERLFGGFRFTDPEIETKVFDGSIADCSVYLRGNVHHPGTGQRYPWTLQHVLLTNDPLVQGLAPFGQVPAAGLSLSGYQSVHHISLQEVSMSNATGQTDQDTQGEGATIELTAQDLADLQEYRALGQVAELAAIAAQRDDFAQRARSLRITEIVAALEGVAPFDGIVQVDGRRHFPAVIAEAERILQAVDVADVMAAGDTPPAVDGVVIQLLNAIPADGRMEVPAAPPRDRSGGANSLRLEGGDVDPDALTDEAISELDAQLQGAG